MKTVFKSSFAKDLKTIKSKTVLAHIAQLIDMLEKAESLRSIPEVKKLKTRGNFYRIKLGEHRVGITATKDEVTFVRCLDRKEIYRFFP